MMEEIVFMDAKEELDKYLLTQNVLTIATVDSDGPWLCHVFYGYHNGSFYFSSKKSSRHASDIGKGAILAFGVADTGQDPSGAPIGVQGVGFCRPATIKDVPYVINYYAKRFAAYAAKYGNEELAAQFLGKDASRLFVVEIRFAKFTNKKIFEKPEIIQIR